MFMDLNIVLSTQNINNKSKIMDYENYFKTYAEDGPLPI